MATPLPVGGQKAGERKGLGVEGGGKSRKRFQWRQVNGRD